MFSYRHVFELWVPLLTKHEKCPYIASMYIYLYEDEKDQNKGLFVLLTCSTTVCTVYVRHNRSICAISQSRCVMLHDGSILQDISDFTNLL